METKFLVIGVILLLSFTGSWRTINRLKVSSYSDTGFVKFFKWVRMSALALSIASFYHYFKVIPSNLLNRPEYLYYIGIAVSVITFIVFGIGMKKLDEE